MQPPDNIEYKCDYCGYEWSEGFTLFRALYCPHCGSFPYKSPRKKRTRLPVLKLSGKAANMYNGNGTKVKRKRVRIKQRKK